MAESIQFLGDINPWAVEQLEDFQFFFCPECFIRTQTREAFINHAVTKHPLARGVIPEIPNKSMRFEVCNKKYPFKLAPLPFGTIFKAINAEILEQHVKTLYPVEKRLLACDQCDIREQRIQSLCNQLYMVYSNNELDKSNPGDGGLQCSYCDVYMALNVETLEIHVRTIHPEKRLFACDQFIHDVDSLLDMETWQNSQLSKKKNKRQRNKKKKNTPVYVDNNDEKIHGKYSVLCDEKKCLIPDKNDCEICDQKDNGSPSESIGTLHQCKHCDNYKSNNDAALEQHVQTLHPEKRPFACDWCDFRGQRSRDLLKHLYMVHSKVKKEFAKSWYMPPLSLEELQKYVKLVHDVDSSVEMPTYDHIQQDQNDVSSPLESIGTLQQCKHCDKAVDVVILEQHVQTLHPDKRPFPCDRCDFRGQRSRNLQKHFNMVHSTVTRKSEDIIYQYTSNELMSYKELVDKKCYYCDYRGASSTLLQNHIKLFHDIDSSVEMPTYDHIQQVHETLMTETKKMPDNDTDDCSEMISRSVVDGDTQQVPDNNEEKVHGIDLVLSQCDEKKPRIPDKTIEDDCEISDQNDVSSPLESIGTLQQCKHCDKAVDVVILEQHVQTLHPDKRPFPCDRCDFRGQRSRNLQKHLNMVHLTVTLTSEELLDKKCQYCDVYVAVNVVTLEIHVRTIHPEKRLFACDQCDYRGVSSKLLQKHIKLVHDVDSSVEMPTYDHIQQVHETLSLPYMDDVDDTKDIDNDMNQNTVEEKKSEEIIYQYTSVEMPAYDHIQQVHETLLSLPYMDDVDDTKDIDNDMNQNTVEERKSEDIIYQYTSDELKSYNPFNNGSREITGRLKKNYLPMT